MKKTIQLAALALLLLMPSLAGAQIVGPKGPPICGNPEVQVQSVVLTGSANTQLVTVGATQRIYVCGINYTDGAAAITQFVTGTGSTCATGQVALTGPMVGNMPQPAQSATGQAILLGGLGQNLCELQTTGPLAGWLYYVVH